MQPILIAAHGQPSDPAPAAAELAGLAKSVARLLPGRRVASATLAEPEALTRAVADLGPTGVVMPLFMAGGWFTRVNLPAKLAQAGGKAWQVLEPLGCAPALHDLAVQVLRASDGREVLLAAHGSSKSTAPSDIANHVAALIRKELAATVTVGFIDQTPTLRDIGGLGPGSVCLPFFAAAGDHVNEDLPAALQLAGFQGKILPSLGLHPEIPRLIAAALQSAQPICATNCRYMRAK